MPVTDRVKIARLLLGERRATPGETLTLFVDRAASKGAYRASWPHWGNGPGRHIGASLPLAAGSRWTCWGSA